MAHILVSLTFSELFAGLICLVHQGIDHHGFSWSPKKIDYVEKLADWEKGSHHEADCKIGGYGGSRWMWKKILERNDGEVSC